MYINTPDADKLFRERWLIPGMGDAKPYCGDEDWITIKCSSGLDGHDHRKLTHGCKSLWCPVCWDEAAWAEAFKAMERFDGIKQEWREKGYKLLHAVRVIVSPPKEQIHLPMDQLRNTARKLLVEVGAVGGADVWHPYRGGQKEVMDKIRAGEKIPVPSPHFHENVFMPKHDDNHLFDKEQIKAIHERTGWVIKIQGRKLLKGANVGQDYNVAQRLHYELTHVGMDMEHPTSHRVTWWGVCSYNNSKVDIEKVEEEDLCSVCGKPNHKYSMHEIAYQPGRRGQIERVDCASMEYYERDGEEVKYELVDEGPHMFRRKVRHYSLTSEMKERVLRKYGDRMGLEYPTETLVGLAI